MPYADPEKRKAKCLEYRKRNLERLRAYDRARRKTPECLAERRAKWKKNYPKIRDKHLARTAEWARNNRSKCCAIVRRYRERHPERVKAMAVATRKRYAKETAIKTKAYQQANPEKVKKWEATRRRKILANPVLHERCKQRDRDYYQKNRAARIAATKDYEIRNKEKVSMWRRLRTARRRIKKLESGGDCSFQQWMGRCDFYGWCCAYCGIKLTPKSVQQEHVKPVSAGGTGWPANLVPACASCNLSKGVKRILPTWISHRQVIPCTLAQSIV